MRSLFLALILSAGPLLALELAGIHPPEGASEVPVSASLHLRFSSPLDLATLGGLTLHRLGEDGESSVAIEPASDLTNASITLAPRGFLDARTTYEVRGSKQVVARDGAALEPFRSRFTTGARAFDRGERLVFAQERFDGTRSMTAVLFGPDRRLYAADAFGHLVRWELRDDGTPVNKQVLLDDPSESRQYIDLEWDPAASAEALVLWASYSERLSPKGPRHYFTGTIARIDLRDTIRETVVVTGLPHGRERQGGFDTLPHQPNGLVFRDGMLYQSVGSTSSSGGPPNWGIEEQPLSACILEIDYRNIPAPLDVHPESGYVPGAENAPVRLFATGVRNALELLAHRNGRLYTATNINDRQGPGDGVPDHPGIPGDQNKLVTHTTPDHESLYLLERGRHYGFPNPSRGQFVLNGGNPTARDDPFEIPDYPVGTQPDAGFAPDLCFPIWQHGGTSPNGMIEYLPEFAHPLRKAILCCFFSARDLAALTLGADGLPAAVEKLRGPEGKLQFNGPLDLTMDPRTGILYLADFGRQGSFGADGSMILLRPAIAPD